MENKNEMAYSNTVESSMHMQQVGSTSPPKMVPPPPLLQVSPAMHLQIPPPLSPNNMQTTIQIMPLLSNPVGITNSMLQQPPPNQMPNQQQLGPPNRFQGPIRGG